MAGQYKADRTKRPTDARRRAQQITEQRAQFCRDLIVSRPSLMFADRIAHIRKEFSCGKTAAELAHARDGHRPDLVLRPVVHFDPSGDHEVALPHGRVELLAQAMKEYYAAGIEDILARAAEDEEAARRKGDLRAANRIRIDTARLNGMGVPDRVQLSGGVTVATVDASELDGLTEEQLAVLATIGARKTP